MRRHDQDSDRLTGDHEHDEHEEQVSQGYERPLSPGARTYMLGERPVHAAALPLNPLSDQEVEARRNLEHVGRILQRLDREHAEINRLRKETRAMLAEMAA